MVEIFSDESQKVHFANFNILYRNKPNPNALFVRILGYYIVGTFYKVLEAEIGMNTIEKLCLLLFQITNIVMLKLTYSKAIWYELE